MTASCLISLILLTVNFPTYYEAKNAEINEAITEGKMLYEVNAGENGIKTTRLYESTFVASYIGIIIFAIMAQTQGKLEEKK